MRRLTTRQPIDLGVVFCVLVLAILAALYSWPPFVRIPLTLCLAFFLPGYTAIALFFPSAYKVGYRPRFRLFFRSSITDARQVGLEPLERIALSMGVSILVTVGMAFLLDEVASVTLPNLASALELATGILLGFAFVARLLNPMPNRLAFSIELHGSEPPSKLAFLALILGVVAFSSASVFYFHDRPRSDHFTEFYVLGEQGTLSCYPEVFENDHFSPADPSCPAIVSNVTVVVSNHEGHTQSYVLRASWRQPLDPAIPNGPATIVPIREMSFSLESESFGFNRPQAQWNYTFALEAPAFQGNYELTFELFSPDSISNQQEPDEVLRLQIRT